MGRTMMLYGKPTILVVEDDAPIRNLITTTLETQNYKYITAEDGAKAIFSATSGSADIILLDLGLPDIDGVEVIKKIRSWSVIPIIVISARSDDKDKIQALDAEQLKIGLQVLTKTRENRVVLQTLKDMIPTYHSKQLENILKENQ